MPYFTPARPIRYAQIPRGVSGLHGPASPAEDVAAHARVRAMSLRPYLAGLSGLRGPVRFSGKRGDMTPLFSGLGCSCRECRTGMSWLGQDDGSDIPTVDTGISTTLSPEDSAINISSPPGVITDLSTIPLAPIPVAATIVPSSPSALSTIAGVLPSTIPLLTNAGQKAPITNLAKTAAKPGIIPGLSNTTLMIGAAALVLLAALGGKR